jgi:hypothetical protein
MVSMIYLTIIGIGISVVFVLLLIMSENVSAPPSKIWINYREYPCGNTPNTEYLESNGITVYDSSRTFKKEYETFCEGCNCSTGYIVSYLISKKDMLKLKDIMTNQFVKKEQCGLLGYAWHDRENWDNQGSACLISMHECKKLGGLSRHTSSCPTCEDVIYLCDLP